MSDIAQTVKALHGKATANRGGVTTITVETLTAILAALEKSEKYRASLERIAQHYTDTDLAAKHMRAIAKSGLSPTGDSRDYEARRAGQ